MDILRENQKVEEFGHSLRSSYFCGDFTATCGECKLSVSSDRYVMKISGQDISYHESCLNCSICKGSLMHSCFFRDGKLFCKIDYERIYSKNKCLSCGDKIHHNEFVYRTSDYIFHLRCFVCVVCGCQLVKGDQFVVKACQLFCRNDYEKEVEMLQSFNYEEYLCDDICTKTNRRGPKRPRTILTTQQRRAFKACFDISPRPCRKTRESLAADTGLSLRIVQVWFQNQRAKMKKIEKKDKQKSEITDGTNEATKNIKDENEKALHYIKDEIQSDNESLASVGSSYTIEDPLHPKLEYLEEKHALKDSNKPNTSHRGGGKLHPYQEYSTPTEFVPENMNNMQLEIPNNSHMAIGNQQHIHNLNQMPGQVIGGPNNNNAQFTLNPIDRLYSMQNMYFCSNEKKDQL